MLATQTRDKKKWVRRNFSIGNAHISLHAEAERFRRLTGSPAYVGFGGGGDLMSLGVCTARLLGVCTARLPGICQKWSLFSCQDARLRYLNEYYTLKNTDWWE
jgi:hypothetical protein